MKEYKVTFIRRDEYYVFGRDIEDAINNAYDVYVADKYIPFADYHYDDVYVEELEDSDDE